MFEREESLTCFISLEVIIIKHGKRSMGYGFAAYGTLAEAEKASKELSQKELDGREIRIQVANPQEAKKTKKPKRKRASKKSRKNVSRSFLRIMLFFNAPYRLIVMNQAKKKRRIHLLTMKLLLLPLLLLLLPLLTHPRTKKSKNLN